MTSLEHITRASRHRCIAFMFVFVLIATGFFASSNVVCAGDETPAATGADTPKRMFLPVVGQAIWSSDPGASYETIPVDQPSPDGRPAAAHGDLNLALRGYIATAATLQFVDYSGATDDRAPQLPGIFSDGRAPEFTSVHRVYDWDWGCGADGCRGAPLSYPPVTLLGMRARPGEILSAPSRSAEIYAGGYRTLVLYAEATRITLVYTRNDHVIDGYTVHLEGISVNPALLALYRQANATGRSALPALRNNQPLGIAAQNEIRVAVRDRGAFMDPRSRKDWWQGY